MFKTKVRAVNAVMQKGTEQHSFTQLWQIIPPSFLY